ncbi:MAG: S-adenosyl-L-methionine-binding protein [Candidatus Methanofastidiosum methylothiophilum]|uniref:S-adenosyl-L-methionine-binding protein n=1 Tax=Candidatus Methanofastidiosum methylothiophilum TaxID=1705564 RepID=A0A150IWF7_9EURY|nr:MAG: S-adenosyl-L-methionine-binding protein [Candidatus Methanofastidiosum methylthiophilus]KYC46822.1 MAG: S-adenosyl-L-methionine-binding protein [Candidatus Methanofastidiosum methylthiophilus]KYC49252.1 MAG: S-adenosyl-L-methionine-binding protein [Candidatus Methanofastidiosum methylthiophilus]
MKEIKLKPIGLVHSPFNEPINVPKDSTDGMEYKGTVEIFPEYRAGLKDLEGFSHILIIFYFHRSDYSNLIVKPYLDDNLRGVFATRSPHRPNFIGLSIVELLNVEGEILHIRGIDMIEGTPVLDIKPYIPEFESNEGIRIGWLEGKI